MYIRFIFFFSNLLCNGGKVISIGIFFLNVNNKLVFIFLVVVLINIIFIFFLVLVLFNFLNFFLFKIENSIFWFFGGNLCILFKNKIFLLVFFIRFGVLYLVFVNVFFLYLNNKDNNNCGLLL